MSAACFEVKFKQAYPLVVGENAPMCFGVVALWITCHAPAMRRGVFFERGGDDAFFLGRNAANNCPVSFLDGALCEGMLCCDEGRFPTRDEEAA